jgi:hypothetical protein
MSVRPVLLALALACAPHGPPQTGAVALTRPISLLPIDACDGALARVIDASDAELAGLGRDQQVHYSDRLPPEQEVFATSTSRGALETYVRDRPALAPPAGRRYGYEEFVEHDGVARWRMHCMLDRGVELHTVVGAVVVDDPDRALVRIAMAAADAQAFRALTETYFGRRIAVVVDDEVLMTPVVRMAISGGVVDIDLGATEQGPRAAADALLGRLLGR